MPTRIVSPRHVQGNHVDTARPLYRAVQLIWNIFTIIEVLLAFRFVLRLLGANPDAAFTQFIYSVTYPFVAPFLNVFSITNIEGSVFDWAILLAMVVYWIVARILVGLLMIGKPMSTREAAAKLDRYENRR